MKAYTWDEIEDEFEGKIGTPERTEYERLFAEELESFRIGEAIKTAREEKNITKEQLCQMSGVNKAQISRIENGRNVSLGNINRVLLALGLRITINQIDNVGLSIG